jgi:hypothetical protein
MEAIHSRKRQNLNSKSSNTGQTKPRINVSLLELSHLLAAEHYAMQSMVFLEISRGPVNSIRRHFRDINRGLNLQRFLPDG